MNKTININLAGVIFHVDEDAYSILRDYLNKLKAQFSKEEGSEEILLDIEARMAELFSSRLADKREVIGIKDVQEVISIMGKPEEYIDENEAEDPNMKTSSESISEKSQRRLYRDGEDKVLGGVCSGLGAYFNIDPLWIRLIFAALFFGLGTGFWLYIILWIVIPEAKTTAQKLQMRGEKINISNIEKSVREEIKNVEQTFQNLSKDERLKKSGNRIASVLEDLFMFIISTVGAIFKFIVKLLGIVFIGIAVVVLVILFSAAVGHGIEFNEGVTVGISELHPYFLALMPVGFHESYVILALLLLVTGPITALILGSSRLLFDYKVKSRALKGLAALFSFSGFVMFLILGFAIAKEFKGRESKTETIALHSNTEVLRIIRSESHFDIPYDSDWFVDESNIIVIDNVRLDIRKTQEIDSYVEIRKKSHGHSRSHASELVSNIQFDIRQNENQLLLDPYLLVPIEDRFRNQEVDVVLFLSIGTSIYIDESIKDILHEARNTDNTFEPFMVRHTYTMTDNGLLCKDCLDNKGNENSFKKWEENWLKEAHEYDKMTSEI